MNPVGNGDRRRKTQRMTSGICVSFRCQTEGMPAHRAARTALYCQLPPEAWTNSIRSRRSRRARRITSIGEKSTKPSATRHSLVMRVIGNATWRTPAASQAALNASELARGMTISVRAASPSAAATRTIRICGPPSLASSMILATSIKILVRHRCFL